MSDGGIGGLMGRVMVVVLVRERSGGGWDDCMVAVGPILMEEGGGRDGLEEGPGMDEEVDVGFVVVGCRGR